MEKKIFSKLFAHLRQGAFEVRYWDGSKQRLGKGPLYFIMTVHTPKVLRAIFRNNSLGFGEGYMNGQIDIDGNLDQVGRLVAENAAQLKGLTFTKAFKHRERNTPKRQQGQISRHYDIGNDFYKLWLDKSMTYSCAYFEKPDNSLEKAQQQKVDHLIRKLDLRDGHHLLDIGCGWGTLLLTAAKRHKITGLGITLSKEQLKFATDRAKELGLDKQIKFRLANYRDLVGTGLKFDRIISVGMFEHVGKHNHDSYFEAINEMLVPGGISVLHTITNQVPTRHDPWIDRYIFPGGYIPAVGEVIDHIVRGNFRLIDYENLRIHYAMTLDEWLRRFEQNVDKVEKMFDARFVRMWRLYLAASSAGFRYGDMGLSQYVFTKGLNNELPLTRAHIYHKA